MDLSVIEPIFLLRCETVWFYTKSDGINFRMCYLFAKSSITSYLLCLELSKKKNPGEYYKISQRA